MNATSPNVTVVIGYRDSLTKAVIKNVIVVVLGISINYINICLIQTFSKHQVFNTNPRYILFLHLVVNDMIQVSLSVFLFIISYTLYKINVSICGAFILLTLFATENTPLNLACMAVECYIAICLPLRHVQICTVRRTKVLIGLIWTTSMMSVLPDLFITLATEPPAFFKSRVFCVRETVFRNPHIIRKRDITYIVYLAVVWIVILYTYFKIIFTVKMVNNDARKAQNTILLHGFQVMLCMATYAEPQLRLALHKAFPEHSNDFSFACYVVVYVLPRSISPVVYGIRDSTFRKYLQRHLRRNQIFRNPRLKEKRDISFIVLLVLVWLTLVYAYFNILFAAQGATSNARKARNTVLLHGFQLSLCMLTYTYNQISNGLIALFPQYVTDIRFITTILFQVLPRLLSPLIYGLRDKTFRKCVKRSLCSAERGGAIQRKDEERPAHGHTG
ncbi:odorant receptor 131-2-like [Neosynchiropus ocellatus]